MELDAKVMVEKRSRAGRPEPGNPKLTWEARSENQACARTGPNSGAQTGTRAIVMARMDQPALGESWHRPHLVPAMRLFWGLNLQQPISSAKTAAPAFRANLDPSTAWRWPTVAHRPPLTFYPFSLQVPSAMLR